MNYWHLFAFLLLISCQSSDSKVNSTSTIPLPQDSVDNGMLALEQVARIPNSTVNPGEDIRRVDSFISPLQKSMLDYGLVDVQSQNPKIKIDLKYASDDNFLGQDVYDGLKVAFLQKRAARMLSKAADSLSKTDPKLHLLVYDGARPQSVQFKMWDIVKGTPQQRYVAEPNRGSLHNFGSAVDLSIIHADTGELDMGTPYDYFGDLAQPRYEGRFLGEGKLNQTQIDNRNILRRVMRKAGFQMIMTEWWHFNALPKEEARKRYEIIK